MIGRLLAVRAQIARWPRAVVLAFAVAGLLVGPRTLAGWDGSAWFEGDAGTQDDRRAPVRRPGDRRDRTDGAPSWPPDVAAVAGSIGLHARATGMDALVRPLLRRWAERFEACAVHPSGLLIQRLATGSCEPRDAPRGSGTAVAAYFLSFAAPELAARLYRALEIVDVLGFAGVREYGAGSRGPGDFDAGPILAGMSVGATGFALGAARSQRDRSRFVALYRSTSLFGVPTDLPGGRMSFALGGALGNALLIAMLTARAP